MDLNKARKGHNFTQVPHSFPRASAFDACRNAYLVGGTVMDLNKRMNLKGRDFTHALHASLRVSATCVSVTPAMHVSQVQSITAIVLAVIGAVSKDGISTPS